MEGVATKKAKTNQTGTRISQPTIKKGRLKQGRGKQVTVPKMALKEVGRPY